MTARAAIFRETQRWRDQVWVMVLVIGLAAFTWYGFIEQIILGRPFGNNPAPDGMMLVITVLFGLGLPIFFLTLQMTVEVLPDRLRIIYGFLVRRDIPLADITLIEAVVYSPLRDWGGWGIRGFGRRIAYNVGGNEGVALRLVDGREVLIGSQQADRLAAAISRTRR